MVAFIFGGDTNETPETIKRKRDIARALMAAQGAPRNVGEGLNALGDGIVAAVLDRRAASAEKAGLESAAKDFAPLASMFGGGASSSASSGGTMAAKPDDPRVGSTIDFARGEASGASADVAGLESYIRDAATKRGIDPDVAVRVARSEGLAPGVWQSNVVKNGRRETSYGPFQLLVGGGLGDKFQKVYGKSPADPSTVRQQIDFALDEAATGGWSPWYGAAKVGVGARTGLENARALGYQPAQVASLDPSIGMPEAASEVSATAPQPQPAPTNVPAPAQAPRQVAQALTAPQQPQMGGGFDTGAIMKALSNPFLPEGQRAVAEALLQQENARRQAILEQQIKQNDPAYQLGLQKGQIELDNLRNPKLSPAEQARIDADKERLGFDREKFTADQADKALTPDIKEYNFYAEREKAAGRQPLGPLEWDITRRKSSAQNTTVTVGGEPSDGNLRKKLDEKTGELWSTYQEQGATSAAAAQDFGVLDELIKVAPQGPIQGRLAEMFPGVSSAGDAFQSIVKRVAPTLRAPGSGATSDIEYDGMLRSLPALRNSPEANQAINEIMKAKAAINVERSSIIDQYGRGEISAADARSKISEIDKRSIMTPELKKALEGVGTKPAEDNIGSPAVGTVMDGYRFKGGDPADQNNWERQ